MVTLRRASKQSGRLGRRLYDTSNVFREVQLQVAAKG